jgi:signal transduction histidine kinase
LTCFDLAALLTECMEIMQAKADECHIAMELEIQADFPQVKADRDKIKQVVLNLLSNAIKYNCQNGKVNLLAGLNGKQWYLAISDTGNGIPVKALPHLFQKFYRVQASEGKVAGTGLGLSICKQIVSGHGGTIDVESKYRHGATFTIRIPIV